MATKPVKFSKSGSEQLPLNKPVLYRLLTETGKTTHVGIAKRGPAQERIQEHLYQGRIAGAKVRVEQVSSIAEAEKKEQAIIARSQPK